MLRRIRAHAVAAFAIAILLAGCGDGAAAPTPTPEPTATPRPPTATAVPPATPTPPLAAGTAIVVGGELRARAAPTTQSNIVRTLQDRERVQIVETVQGENWLVGAQTWVATSPDWARTWYKLADGSFVYAPFIFVLPPNEASPLAETGTAERWIDVNVTAQTATAMVGDRPVYIGRVSTGSREFPTPLGSHRIEIDGRIVVERMTASQAGYNPGQATYDVERVLFTQYFDRNGNALHLNYWRPTEVFGVTPTSHGCVGMQMHDAQYFWLFAMAGTRVEVHP